MTEPNPSPDQQATEKEKEAYEVWMDEHPKATGGLGCLALLVIIGVVGAIFGAGDDDKKKDDKPAASASATTKSESPKAKTTKEPATPEQVLRKAVKSKLGKVNRDNVKRVSSVVYNEDYKTVVIKWALNENLTKGLTRTDARVDIVDLLKVLQDFGKDHPIRSATLWGTYSLVDQLGDTSEDKVVQVEYPWSTIKAVRFDNFNNKNVYAVADDAFLHPALQDD